MRNGLLIIAGFFDFGRHLNIDCEHSLTSTTLQRRPTSACLAASSYRSFRPEHMMSDKRRAISVWRFERVERTRLHFRLQGE